MTPNPQSGWQLAGPNLREDPEIWARGCGRSGQEHGLPANRKLVRIRKGIQNLQRLPAHAELFRRWGAKIALPGPMRQIAGALMRPLAGRDGARVESSKRFGQRPRGASLSVPRLPMAAGRIASWSGGPSPGNPR